MEMNHELIGKIIYVILAVCVLLRTILGIHSLNDIKHMIPRDALDDTYMHYNNYPNVLHRGLSITLTYIIGLVVLADYLEFQSGYPLLYSILGLSAFNMIQKSYVDYEGLSVKHIRLLLILSYVFLVLQCLTPIFQKYIVG